MHMHLWKMKYVYWTVAVGHTKHNLFNFIEKLNKKIKLKERTFT